MSKFIIQIVLAKLPTDIQDLVFTFYNPYKEYFTKNIIQTTHLWEQAWMRRFRRESEPKVHFAMEHMLMLWGVLPDHPFLPSEPDDGDKYKQTQYLPSDVSIFCQTGYNCLHIAIYHESCNNSNIDFIFMGEVFTHEQYKLFVQEERSENPTRDYISVHSNDEYYLERII